jgi:hypothetical protein
VLEEHSIEDKGIFMRLSCVVTIDPREPLLPQLEQTLEQHEHLKNRAFLLQSLLYVDTTKTK